MSTIAEHLAAMRREFESHTWLSNRFQQAAALFCGAHLPQIEAAFRALWEIHDRSWADGDPAEAVRHARAMWAISDAALGPQDTLNRITADYTPERMAGRDVLAAAERVATMTGDDILLFARHDPDIFRDVARLALATRPLVPVKGCGAVDCVNACDGDFTWETCPNAASGRDLPRIAEGGDASVLPPDLSEPGKGGVSE